MKVIEIAEFQLEFNRKLQKEFIKQNESKLMKHIFRNMNYTKKSRMDSINTLISYLKTVCDIFISFDLLDEMCSNCGVSDDNS